MNHDFYWAFSRFWWLIFPLFGMGMGTLNIWLRHSRANRRLDILKSYVDQGKEPPPELMQYLRAPPEPRRDRNPGNSVFLAFLFAGLAAAFAFTGFLEHEPHVYFLVILFGALALGMAMKAIMCRGSDGPSDRP